MNIVSSCCPEVCLYTHRLIQRSVLIRHKWHISVTALLPKALENVTEEGGKILRVVGCWGRLCYSVFWTTGRDCCTHKPQWQIKPVSLPARMKRALQGPTPKLRKGEAVPWPLQLQFSHMVTCNLQERNLSKNRTRSQKLFSAPQPPARTFSELFPGVLPQLAIVYFFFSLPNVFASDWRSTWWDGTSDLCRQESGGGRKPRMRKNTPTLPAYVVTG